MATPLPSSSPSSTPPPRPTSFVHAFCVSSINQYGLSGYVHLCHIQSWHPLSHTHSHGIFLMPHPLTWYISCHTHSQGYLVATPNSPGILLSLLFFTSSSTRFESSHMLSYEGDGQMSTMGAFIKPL